MNNYPKIAVLLSTYNGEKFLSEQLDSLLEQTYSNLIIVVRDDDSHDDTDLILDDYSTRYKEKIHRILGDKNNLGASGSFSCLVEYALREKERLGLTSAYLMFCDQDDIWVPEKVAIQVKEMLATEKRIPTQPVLIHSDLYVVSATNQLIAESFIRYQGLELKRNDFANIIISNLVTGCTALINEELAKNAIPIPKKDADMSFDAATCIGCGACVATCKNGSAMLFVSAKVSQFSLLPQGKVEANRRALNMVGKMDELGFGNCTNTGACEVECPKGISLDNIARMNSDFLKASILSEE